MCSKLQLGEVTICALLFSSRDTCFSDTFKSLFIKMEEANTENEIKNIVKQIVKIKNYIRKNYMPYFLDH